MNKIKLTKEQARNYLCNYHFINSKEEPKDILEVFDRLQSIQYDPLDVVGKNTDLVLQARLSGYRKGDINKTLYEDRLLVDGWDKQMCVYKTSDFNKLTYIREARSRSAINILRHRLQIEALDYIDQVLEILKEGPKFSSEVRIGESLKHSWGHTKPSSATFDYLFHQGRVGVRSRRNTQKQFDLIENLIPNINYLDNEFNSETEFSNYYLLRRIKSLGLVTLKSGVHFSGPFIDKKTNRTKIFKHLIDNNKIIECEIEGLSNKYYILPEYEQYINDTSDKVSFIAPLDNFIWDRDLIEDLFDYNYRWEVYTPVIKRQYGYYVLPMIYKNKFIGRIEFNQQRNNDELTIKNVFFEENVRITKVIEKNINQALKRFSKYLNANDYERFIKE